MGNLTIEIDRVHSRAVCTAVGARLKLELAKTNSEPPLQIRRQLDRLRDLDNTEAGRL